MILGAPRRIIAPGYIGTIDPYWLARGLVSAVCHPHGVMMDVAAQQFTNSNTGTIDVGDRGFGTAFSSTTFADFATAPPYDQLYAGAISALVGMRLNALTNYSQMLSKQTGTTTNVPFEFCAITSTASQMSLVRAGANVTVWKSTTTTMLSAGAYSVAGVAVPGNLCQSIPTFYCDGVVSDATLDFNTASPSDVVTDAGGNYRIGRRFDGATQLDGTVYFAWLFNRYLHDGEMLALMADPFQIFSTMAFNVPDGAGAGGGSTRRRFFIV